VAWIINTRDAAARFNSHDTLLEEALSTPSPDDRVSVCLLYGPISFDLLFEPALPDVKIVACHDSAILNGDACLGGGNQLAGFFSD
jgi:hypothetical protein